MEFSPKNLQAFRLQIYFCFYFQRDDLFSRVEQEVNFCAVAVVCPVVGSKASAAKFCISHVFPAFIFSVDEIATLISSTKNTETSVHSL
jgi:hypothetical protein